MTHYEVLGVSPDASAAGIRRAYVRLARQHHPDYFAAAATPVRLDAERRMRAINEAWAVLGDEGRRRVYDRAQGLDGHVAGGDEGHGFRPFDPDDDGFDPLDLPDEPYRDGQPGGSTVVRALTLAPVLAFAVSIALLALGIVVGSLAVLALALAAFLVSCLGFVVAPLLALSRATRDE